jgi:hypothetical protein
MVDSSFYQSDDPGRIVQSFSIIGLNENNLSLYDEEAKKPIFVEKIDIIKKNLLSARNIYEPRNNEKWHNINSEFLLRIEFNENYQRPITAIKVIECEYESPEYLVKKFKKTKKIIFIEY